MQLVNGTDTKKVYKGTPEQLGFELAKLEFNSGVTYSHTIYTKEFIDSDKDIQEIYNLLEKLGFSVNDHEFIDGEGYIVCGLPCQYEGYPDIEGMKKVQKNILNYICNKVEEKQFYQIAKGLRNTVNDWEYDMCA
jgi:intein/homing endonuclease